MSKTKILPCIVTTLKNSETLYLLDYDKNMVYCTKDSLKSLNIEHIRDSFNNNKKPEQNKFNITNFKNDCNYKEGVFVEGVFLEKPDLTKKPEEFLANEVIINDEILNKYNLSDISLNIFEKTKLFQFYIDNTNDLQLYNQLNNNEKKRLACTLYYYYISGDNFLFSVLSRNLDIERQKTDFNENDYIQQYYKDNKKQIQDSIDILTEFRDVFIIIVGKTEEDKFKIVGGIGGLIAIIIAIIAIIAALVYYKIRAK
jgi:hypothetical protein